MNLNQFLVLESKLFLKVCEVLPCTALLVKYYSVFLIAYPRIRLRSSYASMLACLGGVLYKWNSKKGNHICDITDFLLPNLRKLFIIIYFSSEKCPIIFKAYNSQLVYMGNVIVLILNSILVLISFLTKVYFFEEELKYLIEAGKGWNLVCFLFSI